MRDESNTTPYVCMIAGVLALLGILFWWPLGLASIVLVVMWGRHFICALMLGAMLDVLWGQPPGGILHMLIVPCTLAALSVILVRLISERFVRT